MLHIDLVIVRDAIELSGRDTGADMRSDEIEQLGGEFACDAHLVDLFRGLDGNGHHRFRVRVRSTPRCVSRVMRATDR